LSYQCPKGHMSTDPDYCSECGAKIGKSPVSSNTSVNFAPGPAKEEICPDCGTQRTLNARFCEVCRHDFVDGKTGTAEKVVEANQPVVDKQPAADKGPSAAPQSSQTEIKQETPSNPQESPDNTADVAKAASSSSGSNVVSKDDIVISEKLNIVISVDKNRLSQNTVESNIKHDTMDRVFPLDLDENLVGRRSAGKNIYPEIEINDPGVSHRHLKFNKQPDGAFAVLELGSANGTELNGVQLESGVSTVIKAGDQFAIGLWTTLKVVAR